MLVSSDLTDAIAATTLTWSCQNFSNKQLPLLSLVGTIIVLSHRCIAWTLARWICEMFLGGESLCLHSCHCTSISYLVVSGPWKGWHESLTYFDLPVKNSWTWIIEVAHVQPSITVKAVTRTAVQGNILINRNHRTLKDFANGIVSCFLVHFFTMTFSIIHHYRWCDSWAFFPLPFRSFPNNYWDKFVKRKVGVTVYEDPGLWSQRILCYHYLSL